MGKFMFGSMNMESLTPVSGRWKKRLLGHETECDLLAVLLDDNLDCDTRVLDSNVECGTKVLYGNLD